MRKMIQQFGDNLLVWAATPMLVRQPDRHEVRWKKARALSNLGRHRDAIHEFEILLRAEQREVDCLYEIASCFADLGDFDEARMHVKKALKISPQDKGCLDLLQRIE